ncbi:MAG: helix-turn-helix domain-containing protein [Verrucomicrobiota bacterium]
MESIGEQLRAARHAKKLSLEDVSRATKIKVDILEKIEAEDYSNLSAPMYTKGFIKMYAEHVNLDSATIVDAYLKSQGGLRRQGLAIETEVQIRARRQRELKLPIGSVLRVVGALSVVVVVVLGVHHWWAQRKAAPTPVAKPTTLPVADFEAYYQSKTKPAPVLLEPPPK